MKIHPKKTMQKDKEFINDLNYEGIKLSLSENGFNKNETKNNISMNVFCYENKLTFPINISDQ